MSATNTAVVCGVLPLHAIAVWIVVDDISACELEFAVHAFVEEMDTNAQFVLSFQKLDQIPEGAVVIHGAAFFHCRMPPWYQISVICTTDFLRCMTKVQIYL